MHSGALSGTVTEIKSLNQDQEKGSSVPGGWVGAGSETPAAEPSIQGKAEEGGQGIQPERPRTEVGFLVEPAGQGHGGEVTHSSKLINSL